MKQRIPGFHRIILHWEELLPKWYNIGKILDQEITILREILLMFYNQMMFCLEIIQKFKNLKENIMLLTIIIKVQYLTKMTQGCPAFNRQDLIFLIENNQMRQPSCQQI